MISKIYERAIMDLNGATLRLQHRDPAALRIPGTDYYLLDHVTMGDIVKAAGIKSFDYALPQSFFDDYTRRHGEAPRGVWSYDDKRILGDFVSLYDLLKIIGEKIIAEEAAKVAGVIAQ